MEGVVERGTAKSAQIEGYTIAGKTGTASKVVDNGYSKSEYYASFVGFVPSRKPALTIIVVIESPHGNGYTGGVVAAPCVPSHRRSVAPSTGLRHTAPAAVWSPASRRRLAPGAPVRVPPVASARSRRRQG